MRIVIIEKKLIEKSKLFDKLKHQLKVILCKEQLSLI